MTYTTSFEDGNQSITLPDSATVEDFKKELYKEYAAKYNIGGTYEDASIKIIFAGKELLDDIGLEELEIEDTPVFAYIRELDDIFLQTAKANRIFKKKDLNKGSDEEFSDDD